MKKKFKLNPIFLFLMLIGSYNSSIMIGLASNIERFVISEKGFITDSKTGLEWVVGPDKNTNYEQANQWIAGCSTDGGGWRMPTRKELLGIYQKGTGDLNLDPVFNISGFYAWAEVRDNSYAWAFNFGMGEDCWFTKRTSNYIRVLGVRSTTKSKLKNNNNTLEDVAKGAKHFEVSKEGIVFDSETGLEWIMGPDKDMNYDQATNWVSGCSTAGGGWRMPTRKELAKLYQKDMEGNMDPAFKNFGQCAWAEPRNSTSACFYSFDQGFGYWCAHNASGGKRAFGVRSRP